MKTVRKIIGLVLLVMILIVIIRVVPQAILEMSYNDIMKNLDMSSANGDRIAGYDVKEGTYTISYIPGKLLAKRQKQVGYLLKITRGTTTQKYSDGGYFTINVEGETINAKLIECSTGKTVASQYFEADFPEYVEKGTRLTVSASQISDWITQAYQENIAGKQEKTEETEHTHTWQDATCTDPRTCADCGATEGNALGHNFLPDVCIRCGVGIGGQKQESPAETETRPAALNREEKAKQMVVGQWKLDYIMGGEPYGIIPYESEIEFRINTDQSADITTADGKYSYEWIYGFHFFEDDDSSKDVYGFLLMDDAGNKLYFYHYYDDTVGIITDDHSVFFVRG